MAHDAAREVARRSLFAVAWADIESEILDSLEREAYRRGVEGVDKPVFQGKEHVGDVREYSDRMLELLLKARAPERYASVLTSAARSSTPT